MRFGSLFAGIGGIDLGLERAGMECAWQVEIDEFCQKVLQKHWPDVPKYGDIRDVGKENLETVDLIAGGFPCQPFSVAGKRRGTEDDRHLWPEMLRVISELKPTWVLGENVPGIIPLFLDQAISDLEGEGYKTEQFTIPACAFDAPHKRERLFVVAYYQKGGWHSETQQAVDEKEGRRKQGCGFNNGSKDVADTMQPWGQKGRRASRTRGRTKGERKTQRNGGAGNAIKDVVWLPEPQLGRVAHGIPDRVDRLKSLGNAVVPQVAEHIGRMIMCANEKFIREEPCKVG